ncbi:MAG: outer membrane beta-barrel protein [Edaphocola sp.]
MNIQAKIIAALLIAATLLCGQAFGQKFILGIKTGADFDQTSGSNLNSNFNGYFVAGAYTGLRVNKVKFQVEALFGQSRVTTNDNFINAYGDYVSANANTIKNGTFKINELHMPVILGFNIIPKLLWLHIGPQYSGVVSIDDVDGFLKDGKKVFKSGYLSGLAGLELQLPFNLNIGARYIVGISDRNNTNVPDTWRTNHIQAHIGFSFLK